MSQALQGAAAGAATGAAFGPWGAAIGAVAGGLMGAASPAQPGGGMASGGPFQMPSSGAASSPQATPQAAQAAAFGSGLDGSGWAVNFGSGGISLDNRQNKEITSTGPTADAKADGKASSSADATATPSNPYGQVYTGQADPLGGLFGSVPPLVWYVVIGAVAWRIYKSRK